MTLYQCRLKYYVLYIIVLYILAEEYNGRAIMSISGIEDLRLLGLKMGQIQIILFAIKTIKARSENVTVSSQ